MEKPMKNERVLERAKEAAQKLIPLFVKHGAQNAGMVEVDGHVCIVFDGGSFKLGEPYGKRAGTWKIVGIERPLAITTIFLPSTHHTPSSEVVSDIRRIMVSWQEEGAKDVEQKRRRDIVDETNKKLVGTAVELEPRTMYMDHVRGDGLGEECTFVIKVPINSAVDTATKLVAALTPSS